MPEQQETSNGAVPEAGRWATACSFAQQRLWFLDQLEPGGALYNISSALRLAGALDVAVLERSFQEVIRRHEALRTTFETEGGDVVQVVHESLEAHLGLEDLSGLPPGEREREALRRAKVEAGTPFDLRKGPLVRGKVLRLAEEDHVVLLAMHHIISDGWSMGILVREVSALYAAFSHGRPSPLAELTLQYADYAAWQRERLSGETLARQVSYWKGQLAGLAPLLGLPTDRPRPAEPSYEGALESFALSAEASEALQRLGRQEGATTYMTLLAGLQALLGRYAGTEDVAVGSPIAGRTRPELEGLIGFFVNTLVMRTDLSGDPGTGELLRRVREVTLGAYAHQDVPFEKLVEELQPERSLSHHPLFQVMLILQNAPAEDLILPGLRIQPLADDSSVAKFDLLLSMHEAGGVMKGTLHYSTELFEGETVRRMAGHLSRLLEAMAADPESRPMSLPLLSAQERRQVLEEWNDTGRAYPREICAHELFEAQARRNPEAVAVSFGDERLSYGELERQASRLARHLRGLGVGPEVRVGLCAERSLELVVGLLATLKAGGAYVPVDPEYPRERVAYMLADSGVALLLTQRRLAAELAGTCGRLVLLDEERDDAPEKEAPRALPETLAYVIYTSGSTGRPKGVQIPHRALVNFVVDMGRCLEIGEQDRLLSVTSLSFDIFGLELFVPLSQGGQVVLASREETLDGALLARRLEISGATVMQSTPATWRMLLGSGWSGDGKLKLLCGGEALPGELAGRLLDKGQGLWNLFGPTETTIWSAVYPVEQPREPMPIGRPIANTGLYVLDPSLEPVPVGVAGELYIGGEGLARGYLHRGDLTAERFVPDPFGAAGERLYRTGDLARYLADGTVEFLGRIDHQVKVRGFRIELGEIEAVLRQDPGVEQAVVIAREDRPGDKRLVAYVTGREGQGPEAGRLRDLLSSKLPAYMVPSSLLVLESLPLTPNGKVDRRALPSPDRSEGTREPVAPRTPVEEVLAGIWAEVLGHERVGVEDNFFELGGHSLLATKVVGRVRDALKAELPLRDLFQRPTLAGLAERVEAALRSGAGVESPPLTRRSRPDRLPLSYSQQRLWFLEQAEPGSAAYNLPAAIRLEGPLDLGALERGLNEVLRRHEALRTSFEVVDGAPVQVVAGHLELSLSVVDLSGLGEPEREWETRRLRSQEAARTFDLTRAPLTRMLVLRLSSTEHAVLLTMHHIVSDGWSIGLLISEISRLYAAFVSGGLSPLPDLPIQYADYTLWQREWLHGEALEGQISYWKGQLRGLAPLLALPTDRERPAVRTQRGAVEPFVVPEAVAGSLLALCRREGVTLYMTLLAALQTLLGRYAVEDDIAVGSPVAGRTHRELEGLIGAFINTLVMRTDLSGGPTVQRLLQRVRDVALDAYARQDVPFDRLVEELKPERSLGHHPFFQVMLVLQNAPFEELRLPHLTVRPLAGEISTAKLDLLVSMHEAAGRLHGTIQYSTDLFDRATVRRMAGCLQRLLEAMAGEPGARLPELPLLTGEERRQVLVEWNDTAAEYPAHQHIHGLFEEQGERTPDAIAVSFEDVHLSFAALEDRANRLASHLRGLGVGPERRVAICVERSIEMVIGLLGILKAGGAYVPLDPEYPRERLSFMLSDCGAAVVLTQEHLLAELPEAPVTIVCLDRDERTIGRQPSTRPRSGVQPDNLAYVLYTSGSTGRPKAVANSHRGIVNLLSWLQRRLHLGSGDRVAQKTTYAFDVSLWEVFWPLSTGARMIVARPGAQRDRDHLAEWMATQAITVAHFVPSLLQLVLDGPGLSRCDSLRLVLCGGEALQRRLERRLAQQCPGARRYNMYGPTEASVDALSWPIGDEWPKEALPIGHPLQNTRAYVLGSNLEPVPVGMPGELCLGGDGLVRGYLSRPGLTAERFVPSPFGEPGSRLYRTGDLARYLADGTVEFLGRIDQQVKLRGLRIELGEIEAVLCRHPGVAQAVVMVREDQPGEKRLVAYVVGRDGETPEPGELRAHLSTQLPDAMVPPWIVALESMPLTPNGKLDRKALPVPEELGSRADRVHAAPRTAVERVLAAIWSEVLRLEGVSTSESFFELGGDSILSIQVVSRAREAGYQLTLKQIFQHQTIAELAQVAVPVAQGTASRERMTGEVELTPIQRWFFEQELPRPGHFNQSVLLRLREPVAVEVLERAVRELVRHHDALRLRFERREPGWRQWYAAEEEGVFSSLDLSGEPDRRQALEEHASRAQRSLDITAGPLLRVVHYRLGEAGERLLLAIHHLVVDGVSWRILLEDLQSACEQLRAGRPVELPAKTTSFQEWARRLNEHARSSALSAEAAYWLKAESPARLPVDHADGSNTAASARNVSMTLSEEETRRLLQEVPGVYRTQINDALLAALAQAVSGWTGASRVVVELEGHGREDLFEGVDLSRTVGWLTILYPVALDLGGCAGPGELLKSVKEQLRGIPNRGIGHGLLRHLRDDEIGRQVSGLEPAQIRFNYLGQLDQVLPESGMFAAAAESGGEDRSREGLRPYLLDVNGWVADGRLRLDWAYSEAVHRRETVEALAGSFLRALQELIEHCRSPEAGGFTPSDFPLAGLDQAALQRIADLIGGDL